MNKKMISIIIPCYNTKDYLDKCLNSIINQTYTNLQIIIVNDGSTDGSDSIMEEYKYKDSRIEVIHQKNSGVAVARNKGLSTAKGEYVTFVDSDDYISSVFCEQLANIIEAKDADIVMCKVKTMKKDHEDRIIEDKTLIKNEEKIKVYSKEQTIHNMYLIGDYYDYVCAKMFKRKLFDRILFPEGRVYEDSATVYKLYDRVNKIVVFENELYYYLIGRQNSITTSVYTPKKQTDNYIAINERYNYFAYGKNQITEVAKAGYIRNMLTLLERTYLSESKEIIYSDITSVVKKELPKMVEQVDKNVLFEIVNSYRLACLFLLLKDEKLYEKNIRELYLNNLNSLK